MYKRLNTKVLFAVFAALLVIVIIVYFLEKKKGDKNFSSNIIVIDTTKITSIRFFPESEHFQEIIYKKNNKNWELFFNKKNYNPDLNTIKSILVELANIRSERIAATDKSKWKDFNVGDKQGVRVIINEGDKVSGDFIIGKFSYSQPSNPYFQQGSVFTYIRISGDVNVHCIRGYLNMLFNNKFNEFRNKEITAIATKNLNALEFNYKADSSFSLARTGDYFAIDNNKTDSANTARFISFITRVAGSDFADDVEAKTLTNPFASLTINIKDAAPLVIKAYSTDKYKFLLTSTHNPNTVFNDRNKELFKRIFVSKSYFISPKTPI
ncbi:MAG: DUF4340 domain-containing protein [Bacteroidales bacterium]|nr:DUF4340 domain-containing protein [Bacteroidales bacterium]